MSQGPLLRQRPAAPARRLRRRSRRRERRHSGQRPPDAGVFDRYNIVSEDDRRDAPRKTAEYVSALPRERKHAALAEGGAKAEVS